MGTGVSTSLLTPDLFSENQIKYFEELFKVKSSTYQYRSTQYLTVLTYPTYQPPRLDGVLPYVEDARAASDINRYTVIGTLGSLYRIQENAVSPNPDYYSSAYGINITTADGGVALEDGYTGFFDVDRKPYQDVLPRQILK